MAIFGSNIEAEEGIRSLRKAGFDPSSLSVLAKAGLVEGNQVIACYDAGGRAGLLGQSGAFWTRMWETLSGWAAVLMPGDGFLLVAGPLGKWILAASENASVFGGLSALEAALYGLGLPIEDVRRYEAAVNAGKALVVAHGPASEIGNARAILEP